MARWNRALVTGASAGIGREIATQLAADGTDLVVVARDEPRLNELAASLDVDVEVLRADLADPVELAMVEDRLRDVSSPIDLLVNNAGFGFDGPFHELDLEREAAVVDVNVVAVHRLTHVAATAMVAAGGGGILNVSSLAAFAPLPEGATYAATKAFVNALSEAIHAELEAHGVHVTALCPGYTHTEFHQRAAIDTSNLPSVLWQSAEDVARAGLAGVARNRTIVVPGAPNKVGATLLDVLPGSVRRFAVKRVPR